MSPELQERLLHAAWFFVYAGLELSALYILITAVVNLARSRLPPERLQAYLPGNRVRGYLCAVLFGAISPFCSCSTIPITVGLLRARTHFGPTMAFLFSSPLVNPILVVWFGWYYGWRIAVLYTVLVLVVAMLAGFLLHRLGFDRFVRVLDDDGEAEPAPAAAAGTDAAPAEAAAGAAGCGSEAGGCCAGAPVRGRWWALTAAWRDYRRFLPYLAIGLVIGAFSHGFVPEELIARLAGSDNLLAVPVAALVGIPLYVRGSTMLPVVAALTEKGMAVGTAIALVIGGAGASIPEMILIARIFRWPVILAFLLSVLGMATLAGLAFNLLQPALLGT